MSLADIWGRLFESFIVTIFVGLVWLKFLDSKVACVGPGLVVAVIAGALYFYWGWRKATRAAEAGGSNEEGRS